MNNCTALAPSSKTENTPADLYSQEPEHVEARNALREKIIGKVQARAPENVSVEDIFFEAIRGGKFSEPHIDHTVSVTIAADVIGKFVASGELKLSTTDELVFDGAENWRWPNRSHPKRGPAIPKITVDSMAFRYVSERLKAEPWELPPRLAMTGGQPLVQNLPPPKPKPLLSLVPAEPSQQAIASPTPQSTSIMTTRETSPDLPAFAGRLSEFFEKHIRPNKPSVDEFFFQACKIASESEPPVDTSEAIAVAEKQAAIGITKGWKLPLEQLKRLANAGTFRWPEVGDALYQVDPKKFMAAKARFDQAIPVSLRVDLESMRETRRPFKLISVDDLLRNKMPTDWLIKGVIGRDTVNALVGDPGGGKSFLALAWAMCIATGREWNGRRVEQGPVIVIAGEGNKGIPNRVTAWSKYHGQSLDGVPLYVSERAALIDVDLEVAAVRESVESIAEDLDTPPALIVVDTLARCFQGEENSARDMGAFVRGLDSLREQFGCAILVVHHSGVNPEAKARARGSSALTGAIDTAYVLQSGADGTKTLKNTKNKDAEELDAIAFRLESVWLSDDEDGEPVTSAVLVPCAAPSKSKGPNLNADQLSALNLANGVMNGTGRAPRKDVLAALEADGIEDSKRRHELMRQLERKGVLDRSGTLTILGKVPVATVDEDALAASFG